MGRIEDWPFTSPHKYAEKNFKSNSKKRPNIERTLLAGSLKI
jgi:hypothetical protein